MSVTCVCHARPASACQTVLGIQHTPASLSARLMEGRREQVFVRKTNKKANAANLKDKIYKIHPTVWSMSNSKQSGGRASVPRWFCIWKDASLTRSGSFCVCACVCVCALSDSTFLAPESVVQMKKLSILQRKNILFYLWYKKKNWQLWLPKIHCKSLTMFPVLQDVCIFKQL